MGNLGFTFEFKNQIIIFYRNGKPIKKIKGVEANKFLELTKNQPEKEIQIKIAKLTGNYKRGNEKDAKMHPRNSPK